MAKIVNKWWFTTVSGTTIGIIKTYDEITKVYKFRIGTGYGIDEEIDENFIKNYGNEFFPNMIQ